MNIVLDNHGWHFKNLTKKEWQLIIAAVFYAHEISKSKGKKTKKVKRRKNPYDALAVKIKEQIDEAGHGRE